MITIQTKDELPQERVRERERWEISVFLHQFYQRYLVDHDTAFALSVLSANIVFVGAKANEKAVGCEEFLNILQKHLQNVDRKCEYKLLDFVQVPCGAHCWNCFVEMDTQYVTKQGQLLGCNVRMNFALHKENEQWLIDMLHVSEAANHKQKAQSLQSVDHAVKRFTGSFQDALWKLLDQIVPGGVVGEYLSEGFPLLFANEQFLKMAGYQDHEQFHREIGGLILNSIHPSDQKQVVETIQKALSSGNQYEVDYRMRRQDGSYLWVHDIGRKAVWDDGRAAVISVLIDISNQVDERKKLELESGVDALTGVYNRKGAERRIIRWVKEDTRWLYCIIDLDNFKQVNDIYGHKQGDQVLRYVANRLQKSFGDMGTVYRMGGDEFALFIPEYDTVEWVVGEIRRVMQEYYELLQKECPNTKSTLSIGGVYSQGFPDKGDVYEQADHNLYQIKGNGKAGICLTMLKQN